MCRGRQVRDGGPTVVQCLGPTPTLIRAWHSADPGMTSVCYPSELSVSDIRNDTQPNCSHPTLYVRTFKSFIQSSLLTTFMLYQFSTLLSLRLLLVIWWDLKIHLFARWQHLVPVHWRYFIYVMTQICSINLHLLSYLGLLTGSHLQMLTRYCNIKFRSWWFYPLQSHSMPRAMDF